MLLRFNWNSSNRIIQGAKAVICANRECPNGKEFEPKTHNQKYCSDECCRIATNKRIMEKYYEKKAIRNGASRGCKKCGAQLSRYNDTTLCASCQKKIDITKKSKIKGMINEIS
jgi:hypothetical protein